MSDSISLRGIEFLAVHGVTEAERQRKQRFSVDLTLHMDLSGPADSDRLRDTADYQELGDLVISTANASVHHLLESLAKEIISVVQERWPKAAVTLTVRKLQPPVSFAVQAIEVSLEAPARA